jgi:hypothetical protein
MSLLRENKMNKACLLSLKLDIALTGIKWLMIKEV